MSSNNSTCSSVDCGDRELSSSVTIAASSNQLSTSNTGVIGANTSVDSRVVNSDTTAGVPLVTVPAAVAKNIDSFVRNYAKCNDSSLLSVGENGDPGVLDDVCASGSFDGHDEGFADQIPALPAIVDVDVSTPVEKSPSKTDICANLEKKRSARKGDGVAL